LWREDAQRLAATQSLLSGDVLLAVYGWRRTFRKVSSALAVLASGKWTVQVDSPGDSRRDESDYLHAASSGTSAASDM
jgi:hypothetical protein